MPVMICDVSSIQSITGNGTTDFKLDDWKDGRQNTMTSIR